MPTMLYRGAVISLLVGCATASPNDRTAGDHPDADRGGGDDSGGEQHIDASVDAPPHIDGAPCTVMQVEVLANPKFDTTPEGTGWTATPINATYPIITGDDGASGVTEQSAPDKAWLGGFAQANANDALYQDVAIPASTTALVLTGYFWVKSSDSTTTVYDTGKVELLTTGGTLMESILTVDNTHVHTAWQALNHTFTNAASLAGQTVRLQISTHSDTSLTTSFWFDTFSLQATACQ